MSEHYGHWQLPFTMPLKSLDAYGAQSSCLVPSGPARRLSGQGRAILTREPSINHRAHFSPAAYATWLTSCIQELSIADATGHLENRKTRCYATFRKRIRGTRWRNL